MDMRMLLEAMSKFAGEPEQKPGDQVRGTEKAKKNGKKHPFADRLVGDGAADGGDGGGAAESVVKKSLKSYIAESLGPVLVVHPDWKLSEKVAIEITDVNDVSDFENRWMEQDEDVQDEFGNDSPVWSTRDNGRPPRKIEAMTFDEYVSMVDHWRGDLNNPNNLEENLKKEYQIFLENVDHAPRPGLEGPTRMRSGKIVYYDPKRKTYIDADSQALDEYGPVGTDAPLAPPQNTAPIQQPDMQLGNTSPTGSGIKEPGVQMNQQPITPAGQPPAGQPPNAAAQKATQQSVVQNPQQAAQQAVAANQAATKPATMGPQDIAMGFLKGMGVQNPQKPAIDALAKSLGKNLKTGR